MEASQWEKQMQFVVASHVSESVFDRATVVLDPLGTFNAVVAASSAQKQQGMIGLTFEGINADAMLFVEASPTTTAFHNQGVNHPLLVAWFDANGALVDQVCFQANDATPYRPKAPYVYALELPGTLWSELPDVRLNLVVDGDSVAKELSPQS